MKILLRVIVCIISITLLLSCVNYKPPVTYSKTYDGQIVMVINSPSKGVISLGYRVDVFTGDTIVDRIRITIANGKEIYSVIGCDYKVTKIK